jgi:hypothetical protein
MASLYVNYLLESGLLPNSGKVLEGKVISRVSVESTQGATREGGDGRKHMMETINKNMCDLDDQVFHTLTLTFHSE